MRYLVVANQTLGGHHLIDTVAGHAREGAEIHVTVPATAVDDDDDRGGGERARSVALGRLDEELRRLADAGIDATGNVGPADPLGAIREQLAVAPCTGLVISTLPRTLSRWLHLDLPHRAVTEFNLPVEWLEAASDDDEPHVVHIAVPASTSARLLTHDLPPMRNN